MGSVYILGQTSIQGLSGFTRVIYMVSRSNALNHLRSTNVILKMREKDRGVLRVLCQLYCKEKTGKDSADMYQPLDDAEKLAKRAGTLAAEMEAVIFRGLAREALGELPPVLNGLPGFLRAFDEIVRRQLKVFGKPGFKWNRAMAAELTRISEFVKETTGSYNDEHLAEYLQQFDEDALDSDLSGDAIAKKRNRLIEECPEVYEVVRADARLLGRPSTAI
jgi:hypothetical protein